MGERDESKQPGRGGTLIGILGLLFVLYVFSPGPILLVFDYADHHDLTPNPVLTILEPVLEFYFLPIEYAYDNFEPVEQFYVWYLDLLGTG